MHSLSIALISAAFIFGGALLGMWIQQRLPGHHLSKEMQDLVKLSAGTIATLTALVLGLLVSSAKSSFDAVNTGMVQGSAKIILLDRTLARCGPQALAVREKLKSTVVAGIAMVWPKEKTGTPPLKAYENANGIELIQDQIRELPAQNDAQRQALAQAQQIAGDLGQLRWLSVEQAQNELPPQLLFILVFWLVLLFTSFGLFAPRNAMARLVLFVGACAISAAIFLVLEMNRPLDGMIKVPSAPMRNALHQLDRQHP
jgi:hypothetical protein